MFVHDGQHKAVASFSALCAGERIDGKHGVRQRICGQLRIRIAYDAVRTFRPEQEERVVIVPVIHLHAEGRDRSNIRQIVTEIPVDRIEYELGGIFRVFGHAPLRLAGMLYRQEDAARAERFRIHEIHIADKALIHDPPRFVVIAERVDYDDLSAFSPASSASRKRGKGEKRQKYECRYFFHRFPPLL